MRSPLEESVLSVIRPAREEKDHIARVAEKIIKTTVIQGGADPMIVGSVARGTFIHGDRDLDIFLLFDPALSREELEEEGLRLARSIAEELSDGYFEKYAEHPYISATIEGFDVDLVPCFRVESASAIRSSVDRTPFHTRYIGTKISPLVDDVLLVKQFTKAGGVYGSDQMTEGFSGYLCELLILYYGGFSALVEAAAEWKPGTLIDLEEHRTKEFTEPLIVIDPVDPGRNVSASVSLDRMYEFVELARGYLNAPSRLFFFPPGEPVLTCEELISRINLKGTYLYAITFATPPYIPDVVVPQLRRSLDSIKGLLERNGFSVNSTGCEMFDARCILLFELDAEQVPRTHRHIGPPLWNRTNADRFFEKYMTGSSPGISGGPYIQNGRYVVEIQRRYTHAADLLGSSEVLEVGLGRHVRQSMIGHWEVCSGGECWSSEFAPFLSRFIGRQSPVARILGNEGNLG
ncbi:MAG: CCA tRNA nucleotidyltransferase [Methanoregulaceae archaeon]|jgi:tRNA nucleotidyltransferase (CCA-adding enzyme)|nr:CCA tRNA nucleotidyltransferase [Methanoregulaceae archaeon]MCU0628290.1 CCA tRNA nucleotidyltransferase [Methanoregulaceae archaeon]